MGTDRKIEQRAKVESGFSERRGLLFRISRTDAGLVVAIGLLLTGMVDFVTGSQVWAGPFYLIWIGLAAWTVGWRWALVTVGFAIVATVVLNGTSLYPFQSPATAWDYAFRVPPTLAIVGLLAHARYICDTQWRLARTDPLTGALNRKAFFEMAGAITESKGWHVLAYADLDGLKRLNDAEGHAKGDAGLKAFARHVRKAIRKDDIFARIGGDEFLVYLAVRDAQAGLTVSNRLHRAMNSAGTAGENPLKCSVGALILAPGPRSIDRALRVADELMYEAKQVGAALTVATAREHPGGMIIPGRYVQSETLGEDDEGEFRAENRDEAETGKPKKAA